MSGSFSNVYEDEGRARAYADLEFPGTYWLAFRDLPDLFARHVRGHLALDFGCGAGRSTRFLKACGFEAVGADISAAMVTRARARDPEGEYLLIPDGDLTALEPRRFDLVFCAFTFDNIPGDTKRRALFTSLGGLLAEGGRLVNLVSAAEIYVHEWTSFSTRDFRENREAASGDTVRIVMLDVPDRRPVEDVLCTEADYERLFRESGLRLLDTHCPLGQPSDPWEWVSEEEVSPWSIHVLSRAGGTGDRNEEGTMSAYTAVVSWDRNGDPFAEDDYSRGHRWSFDGGIEVPASASPHVVPLPRSVEAAVDPEEAFVASLASCHMLWFLSVASRRGFVVERYRDEAAGTLGRNAEGRLAMTRVMLRPRVTFAPDARPTEADHEAMHHEAHERCFIASSVRTEVSCEPREEPHGCS